MHIINSEIALASPQLVLFDWDNTLVDSLPSICAAMRSTFQHFNIAHVSDAELLGRIHLAPHDVMQLYFPKNVQVAARNFFLDCYSRDSGVSVMPFSGAEHSLKIMQDSGIQIGIVSNKMHALLVQEITSLGWHHYFFGIVGAGYASADKPSAIPVKKVLESIAVKHGTVKWFVGDSPTDMKTAHNADCVPILFGNNNYCAAYYESCMPRVRFANHHEIAQYLSSV